MGKKAILVAIFLISACATEGDKHEKKVNVIYTEGGETFVKAPTCPDWSSPPSSNYGCATINNYGKMVADPLDLVTGKHSDYYDSIPTSTAVNTLRSSASATTNSSASSSSAN